MNSVTSFKTRVLVCVGFIILIATQVSFASPSLRTIWLEESKTADCPTGFVANKSEWNNLASAVKDWSFSPSCLWDTIKTNAEEYTDMPVRGFTFGTFLGVSAGAGYSSGTELAFMKYDPETLMVGRVKVRTGFVDISLPAGASRTQSVLFGKCEDSLHSYLGWYETFSAVAMSRSWSRKSIMPFHRQLTYCDSITSTRGLTSSVVGASVSHYSQMGDFILVKGPRVQEMIEYIDSINTRQAERSRN